MATGFSRAAQDQKPEQFFANITDLDPVGEFIRFWPYFYDRAGSRRNICLAKARRLKPGGAGSTISAGPLLGMYLNGLDLYCRVF